jgi:hypothetical protein
LTASVELLELAQPVESVELYRGTSLIRNTPLVGPRSSPVPRDLWWSYRGWRFLMSEVPL